MRKLARAGSGLAIAATLILSACGQARHISPATTTPTTPNPATMPRTLSVDEAVALIGRTVTGSRPVLLPKAIPVGYTAEVNVSADDFQVTYASVDGSRRIFFELGCPTAAAAARWDPVIPALPGGNGPLPGR